MEKGDRDRSGGSNSRDRDRNREYESGSKKRAKKKKTEKMISELPKITSMFTRKPAASDSQSESDDMQTPSSSSSLAEPTTTLHHDDTCPDSFIPAPYDDIEIHRATEIHRARYRTCVSVSVYFLLKWKL